MRLQVAVACSILMGACARPTSPLAHQNCYNADAQLASVMKPLEALNAKGCVEEGALAGAASGASECDRLRQELERLAVICPSHAPTLMANAVVSYDEHRADKAQQLLDQILAQPRGFPDAAVLRARIAIEQGNVPFARRLLEQQIRLTPDHAGLHETYGAALYVVRELPMARHELAIAETLGAPHWRIAYHMGLIAEAAGQVDEARRYYAEALEGNPGWTAAASRLTALRAAAAR